MENPNLPPELEEENNQILDQFLQISRKYNSDIESFIPEDKEFTKRVIKFYISVLDYMINHYEEIEVLLYQNFIGFYDVNFLYGPNGDDMSYFDSDFNMIDEEEMRDFCWSFKHEDAPVPKEDFMEAKSKFVKLLAKLD
jgi:hypothetical protein